MTRYWLRTILFSLVPACVAVADDSATGSLEYNRDIRPILAEMCFRCHGADSAARKADLRLDLREQAIEMGSIVPGDSAGSELVRRIESDDEEEVMPPASLHKSVTDEQKAMLKQWIDEGAVYQPHWSLITPTQPAIPDVSQPAWVRNPIDSFILAKMDEAGLTPAPEADKRTLARRLCLDITGLPPTPAEVDAFVADDSPEAYEAYIDRLMNTSAWGEHRGRYWLDAARYADTHGIHFDNFREIWAYRDWVINAFNRNMPFDQFTIEQLAGDLLPERTLEQQIASGFNRCNITTNEGGIIDEEYLVLYARDRTETTSAVWMGLTANCAVCHNHKYDPISQKEFYLLAAFFNNTTQAAKDGNIQNTPPIVMVPKLEDRETHQRLIAELGEASQAVDTHVADCRPEFEKWQTETEPASVTGPVPTEALQFHAPLSGGAADKVNIVVGGENREIQLTTPIQWDAGYAAPQAYTVRPETTMEVADAGDFENNDSFTVSAWVKLPKAGMGGALVARMDDSNGYRGWDLWVQNNRIGMHIIHQWPDDALKVVSKEELKPGVWYHVAASYNGSRRFIGIKIYINGVEQKFDLEAKRLKNTIKTEVPFKIAQRNQSARMDDVALQEIRLYQKELSPTEVTQLASLPRIAFLMNKPAGERSPEEADELFKWWLAAVDNAYQSLAQRRDELAKEKTAIEERGTIAHVMQEKSEPAMAYVLYRGEYDQRRDEVKPAVPAALPAFPSELPANRLGLAQWLLRPEHPLTARVTVNRFWQQVFGAGIVRTAGDFGTMGQLPTHPELLDWLAVDFRESGWDIKRIFKLMLMSSTYRQAAIVTPEKLERDPENQLLARGPRFRMDAEMVRDFGLAVSGLLVRKIGGPSVRPYQPDGVWEAVAMPGSNTREYRTDEGESLYRRSMYTFWKRSAPPASMEIFNAPNREVCTVQRERTNTPLQALVTLNDPQFVESARRLAENLLRDQQTDDDRFVELAKRLIARPLTDDELAVVRGSFADLLGFYRSNEEAAKELISVGASETDASLPPAELAAWTMMTNELMNLDEALNK